MLDAEPVRTAERLQAVTSLVVEESAKARHNAQPDWWVHLSDVYRILIHEPSGGNLWKLC